MTMMHVERISNPQNWIINRQCVVHFDTRKPLQRIQDIFRTAAIIGKLEHLGYDASVGNIRPRITADDNDARGTRVLAKDSPRHSS
jgi:predicted xylose isomerase-like sugar epimerase